MSRVLPLLAFAILPAAVAAPVPPTAAPPEFGASGLITHADMAPVAFDPRPLKPGERLGLREQIKRDVEEKVRRKRPEGGVYGQKPPVAVHMPRARFREGEPVPAYFVLKNPNDEELDLDAHLDLTGSRPRSWGECEVRLTNRATGRSALAPAELTSDYGAHVTVPARGYYCVGCDLGSAPLPPGEYEVDWACHTLRSAPVRFTVLGPDPAAKPTPRRERTTRRYYRIESDEEGERGPLEQGGPFVWAWLDLDPLDTAGVAAALAVGVEGVHAPDLHRIPSRDGVAEVFATWVADPKGDRVTVTLRPAVPGKPVDLADLPCFHVVVEHVGDDREERATELRKLKDVLERAEPRISTPFAVELRLPKDWREDCGVKAGDRVAVMVTSARFEAPQYGDRVQFQKEAKKDEEPSPAPDPAGRGVWRGILQTPFAELPAR